MNNKELEEYLLSEGFEDVGGDEGEGEMYDQHELNITFWLSEIEGKNHISFSHSADGWHTIENPAFDKIKMIVSLFKEAEWTGTGIEDIKIAKKRFRVAIVETLTYFLNKDLEEEV